MFHDGYLNLDICIIQRPAKLLTNNLVLQETFSLKQCEGKGKEEDDSLHFILCNTAC